MKSSLFGAAVVAAVAFASVASAAPVLSSAQVPGASVLQLAQAGGQATVRVKSAILRAEPSTRSKKLASLRRGTKVQVLEDRGDWIRVRAGSQEGFVSSSLLTR